METRHMKKRTYYGILAGVLACALALGGGCGGRSAAGGAAALPAPDGAKSTLKISSVTSRTVVAVDGQAAPAASGTLTIDVAPGVHSITVTRAGYAVANAAALQQVSAALDATMDLIVSFTRETPPLPAGWTAAARPVIPAAAIEVQGADSDAEAGTEPAAEPQSSASLDPATAQ